MFGIGIPEIVVIMVGLFSLLIQLVIPALIAVLITYFMFIKKEWARLDQVIREVEELKKTKT